MIQSILVVLFLSLSAQAQIKNSNLETRHQDLVATAVFNKCGLQELVQLSVEVESIVVDNGIVDQLFKIELAAETESGAYRILVQSLLADHYDHNTQNWGAYSVQQVQCRHN